MKKYLLIAIASVFFASPAIGAGYGDAGCGLGSLVFGDQSGPVQIFAVTTNVIGLQSVAITSGTSNCDASGIVLAEKEQNIFVQQNFASLTKEMAVGEGEGLYTLAGMLGCPSNRASDFGSYTQRNYETIFASTNTTPDEVLDAVKTGLSKDPALFASCIN